MSLRAITALALLTIALPVSSATQNGTAAEHRAAIEGAQSSAGMKGLGELTIEELMERFNVPGVSVAVIHDFEIHWAKGYGIADVETGALVDTETMFQAASISKPVAAMGDAALEERDPHGLEVARADDPKARFRQLLGRGVDITALDGTPHAPDVTTDRQVVDERRPLHPGQRLDLAEHAFEERILRLGGGVRRAGERERQGQDAFGVETRIETPQPDETARQQARAEQQHQCERHFAHYQGTR